MSLLQTGVIATSNLMKMRVAAALANAAEDIENEDPGTPNHAARLAWASAVLQDDLLQEADKIMWRVGLNPTIAAAGEENATDNDIQFVVNSLLDILIEAHG